jgi:LacI family transcriptional regulator, gluconate utilization system Gnt-I transcriptional repressor
MTAATTTQKSATLHDVARAAGVSPITASRALSNPGKVSEKTIARVQQAVEATGYIPNLLAGGLKSKRSLMVAALVPTISVAQFLPTVQALTEALDAAGYQLILGQSGYDHSREEALLNTMIGRRPDGIVVTGLVHSQAARDRLGRLGIPVVETWDLSDRPIDMLVGFSHLKVGSAVAGYFLGKGWQRLGIATGDDHRAAMRREGFVSTVGRDVATVVVPPAAWRWGGGHWANCCSKTPRCKRSTAAQTSWLRACWLRLRSNGCGFPRIWRFAASVMPTSRLTWRRR